MQQQNYNRRGRGGGGGGSGRRGGGRGGRGRGGGVDPNLPWEDGEVCSLKESFGFIYCADRADEVFFHYSQLSRSDFPSVDHDLQLRQEVTFQIGPSKNNSNLAAYNVRKCAQPIEWEFCEGHETGTRFQGLVEKPSSAPPSNGFMDRGGFGNNNNNTSNSNNGRPGVNHNTNMDGNIRVLMKEDNKDQNNPKEGGEDDDTAEAADLSADGPLIRFVLSDLEGGTTSSNSDRRLPQQPRLFKGDLVEFEIVTDRRTKEKYARKIVLLQSEKERVRLEAEKKMLEQATEEHGVITSLKGEYGFLKSNKRREEVFFHYSTIQMDEPSEHGDDMVLQEGQDMKFLVVTEGGDNSNGGAENNNNGGLRRRVSARQVKMQPRGSVQFHDSIAKCRTGMVLYPPQPHDSGHLLDQHGKIRLHEPVTVMDPETGGDKLINEVYLHISDAPGGSFQFRGGTSVGMWVQAGDTLLFDVVQDFVDGTCHAGPTASLTPTDKDATAEEDKDRAVRLIELAWAMRAEGVINNVKDTYGFLHYAERPVDVHFKLFQVLPDPLQRDLRRNMMGYEEKSNRPLKLEVGTEVSFDLSVHGTIHATAAANNHNQRRRNQSNERENLKAQRILFLPPKSIVTNKTLGKTVEAVIAKQDAKQPYAGTVELKDTLQTMSLEERHPLVAKMIDAYLADSNATDPLVFHDVQTSKEDDIVLQLIESKAAQKLKWRHTSSDDKEEVMQPPGKLVITKIEEGAGEEPQSAADDAASVDQSDDGLSVATSNDGGDIDGKPVRKKKKKRSQKPKAVKAIRYDKGSLSSDLRKDVPPSVGDRVEIDIVQTRRTGVVSVHNMKIVERALSEEDPNATGSVEEEEDAHVGVVTEIVSQRRFGFISVMDETAHKREVIFFQFSSVKNGGKSNGAPLRKGDEVKFKIGTEKNGKMVALQVALLPRGTIPSKADKNACTGIVLLEPTYTELKNTKTLNNAHSTTSNNSNGSSRWDSGDDKQLEEIPITKHGCVLMTTDPSGMFSSDEATASSSGVLVRLYYKNGALALHGHGASSSTSGDGDGYPKRGDLVSFVKSKKEGGGLKDIRITTRSAATRLRGKLSDIQLGSLTGPSPDPSTSGSAKFLVDEPKSGEPVSYDIFLSEVVGSEPSVLKQNESVEAILYEGKLYGVCRTSDLYLESKISSNKTKQRPRLNLTVKKDRGGKIMAQSMMAKGPDGTNGFALGWTPRVSRFES
eukprot:CAMPEP_0168753930 /NCGR_PEP_ID=MMETSP0724-20121128/19225_1 /TAXON_ID=265536 /ORGANISM="Amphiprora sp., Strain CCMP467" /LENGTH=1221 /DNA_ID=CAMNT_0008802365 /DNA_START=395 /DNA_END=4060 /DNA_ORIENTATION=+